MTVAETWSAQVNDMIGGWVVTDVALPLSAHDFRKNGDPTKCGYVIAECMTQDDAEGIAALINAAGVTVERAHSHTSRNARVGHAHNSTVWPEPAPGTAG